MHTGGRPYKCDACNEAFRSKSELISHSKRIHKRCKRHQCDECERDFLYIGSLIKHKRIHAGYRPYKCYVCKEGFTQNNDRTKHMRVHSGEKPYTCDICEKGFLYSSSLNLHKKKHTIEKSNVYENHSNEIKKTNIEYI